MLLMFLSLICVVAYLSLGGKVWSMYKTNELYLRAGNKPSKFQVVLIWPLFILAIIMTNVV